ncbi:interleukin-15 receptor subunit alpha isoform X4 [Chaetodon auriga]|uniref:interleukin-15 receptor subunit alpha isoform X4 n=1 Tax=Chaetodon auriga TaxID=39042 RepID=UPI004032AE28
MDLGSALFSVCVMMISLLGAVRCSNGEGVDCPCPKIPLRILTEPPPTTCFQIDGTFRYRCIRGYVRKAGTSDLTRCKLNSSVAKWKEPSLRCIPDPKGTTTQPPSTTATTSTSLQMTQSISISASVSAGTDNTEPTSPGLQVQSDHSPDFVIQTKATDGTTSTSTTAEPSNNRTAIPSVSISKLSSTTTAMIAFASLVIVCALIGISFLCYRRRSKNFAPQHTAEEQMPMNHDPSAPAS